jgi:hypothetical protein
MTGFIGISLQLQLIMTAHTQWLSKTSSIPYWTTSVFSSTVMNDEWLFTHWIPAECRIKKSMEFKKQLHFVTAGGPNRDYRLHGFR